MNAKDLRELGDNLFGKKSSLNSLHQEIGENFYPERATFTLSRSLGTDFAANLMSSYPLLCRRELGNQFGTMLRPTAKPWFHPARRYVKPEDEDNETRQALQWFEETQRRAMYDRMSAFTRATKEGDHDFAAFGQCAISIEVNRDVTGLLYRCWHLRDMAWQENENGVAANKWRKWKPTAQTLCRMFPGKVHPDVVKVNEKTPFDEVEVMHIVVEAEMYDENSRGRPYWSIWYDVTHDHLMEAVPLWTGHYRIPRWQTVSDSQYSFSPAVVAGLPDARLIQAMTYTLLEASEKASNPPIVATQSAVRSDLALYAGGVTWVDADYDERLGEAMRPLTQDFRGFQFGQQALQDTRGLIREAFFLNKLTMPERAPEMTAYEVGQRVQAYVRDALPIFEPMEMEYNAGMCEDSFELMWRNGAFGSPASWPKKLRGADIEFHFESPLHDAMEEQKGQIFVQAKEFLAVGLALDPALQALPKAEVALRDALNAIHVPATWLNNEQVVDQARRQAAAKQQTQELLANMQTGSEAAANLAGAQRDTAQAQASGGAAMQAAA